MNLKLRRAAVAAALPVLLLSFTACGGDDGDSKADSSSETTESDSGTDTGTDTESDAAATEESTAAEEPSAPSAADIPDPVADPEGFETYIATMYQDAGMTEKQATCMAGAFVDNVDLEKVSDPSTISKMMNDDKLTKAMTDCM